MDFRGSRKQGYQPPPPRKATATGTFVTYLQVFMIISLVRLIMIQQGVLFFQIPVFDDLLRFLLNHVVEFLERVGIVDGQPYLSFNFLISL